MQDTPAAPWSSPHDRWFLDHLATHILAFEGDSHVERSESDFEAYEQDNKRRLAGSAGCAPCGVLQHSPLEGWMGAKR